MPCSSIFTETRATNGPILCVFCMLCYVLLCWTRRASRRIFRTPQRLISRLRQSCHNAVVHLKIYINDSQIWIMMDYAEIIANSAVPVPPFTTEFSPGRHTDCTTNPCGSTDWSHGHVTCECHLKALEISEKEGQWPSKQVPASGWFNCFNAAKG